MYILHKHTPFTVTVTEVVFETLPSIEFALHVYVPESFFAMFVNDSDFMNE